MLFFSYRTSFGTSLLLSSRVRPLHIPSVDLTRSKRCDNGDLIGQKPHTPLTYIYEGGRMWFMKQLIRVLGGVFQVD
jgi:hypothetical protein